MRLRTSTFDSRSEMHVSYMTDVEGNWEYFIRSVEASPALSLEGTSADGVPDLALEPGWHFVFGGDSCDKGGAVGGTVRIVRGLVKLKRRYPDRVTLLRQPRDTTSLTAQPPQCRALPHRCADELPPPPCSGQP